MKQYPKQIRWLVFLAIVAMILLIMVLLNVLFEPWLNRFSQAATAIILPFSIALFISYLLAPVFQLLERKFKQPNRLINTIIVFAGVVLLLIFFGRYAGNLVYEQGVNFIENDWPIVKASIADFVANYPFLQSIYDRLAEALTWENLQDLELDIFAVFQSVTNIIITIVLVPVFLFFILNDRDRIYESIIVLFPQKVRPHMIELLKRANKVTTQYFNGRFITMFFMAIIFTIALFILGFKERSILFGFMLGFFDVVPYVGPFIAMILPVLYSLTDETLMFGQYAPFAIAITVIVGQMIQNNVAQPLIMGRETKIHPLLVLSAFVFFGYLFGVVGIILAIPITGMIRTTIDYLKELNKEKLSLNEEEKDKLQEVDKNDESD